MSLMEIWKYVNSKLNEDQVGRMRSRFVSKLIPNIIKGVLSNYLHACLWKDISVAQTFIMVTLIIKVHNWWEILIY